jgi:carboxypeptidase T
MKFCLRSIQLCLIVLLIGFIGITPVSSSKATAFPEPYDCYRSYEEITNRMVELTDLYPSLARLKTIGQSFEGRPIQVLQLGREVETNARPRLVLVSGLKANALAPVELNLRFAETLLSLYGENANANWLLEQTEIHLIVIANPDGRLIAEEQTLAGNDPTWTKNTHAYECATGNGGVALSQNFSYEWSADIPDACSADYPGPSAASESETIAIQTYLEQILAQNPEHSMVIDLQSRGDLLITPFLYSKTADNPFEDDLYMLANKLAFATSTMPARGSSDTFDIVTGNLTDFAYGHLQAPALRFNLGPDLAGGDVTKCWYFNSYLEPEGLFMLTRAAILTADPLTHTQGPEITFTNVENYAYTAHIAGRADDAYFYKAWLAPDEFSAVHHVSFSLDTPPWLPNAVLTTVAGEQLPNEPYLMDFEQIFLLTELTPGKHTLYFQAWDTDPLGEPGHAGMIHAIEIKVPVFTFIPLLIR